MLLISDRQSLAVKNAGSVIRSSSSSHLCLAVLLWMRFFNFYALVLSAVKWVLVRIEKNAYPEPSILRDTQHVLYFTTIPESNRLDFLSTNKHE